MHTDPILCGGLAVAGDLYRRALTLGRDGDACAAAEHADAARVLYGRFGRVGEDARASALSGRFFVVAGRPSDARRAFARAALRFGEAGARRRAAQCRLDAGGIEGRTGNLDRALEAVEAALAAGGAGSFECRCLIEIGRLHLCRGDESAAADALERARACAAGGGFAAREVEASMRLADVDEARGETAVAMTRQRRILGRAPAGALETAIRRRLGRLLLREDRAGEAVAELMVARDLAAAEGDADSSGRVLRRLAVATARLGRPSRAMGLATEALGIFRRRGAVFDAALLRLERARLVLLREDAGAEDADRAWSDALAAQHLFDEAGAAGLLLQSRQLLSRITRRRLAAARRLRVDCAERSPIIAVDPAMRAIVDRCEVYGRCDDPVLITGETGSGKEVLARHVHRSGRRAGSALVAVNVAAIPEAVFEREFFGHVRGAYSGADGDGAGYVAAAEGGTLFLDEIGDLSLRQQPKLLRLLQDGCYSRLGDPREHRADVRLIAATNADLPALVAAGAFRLDLWYRLRVLEMEIPPLRRRPDDIIPLLDHFLGLDRDSPLRTGDCFDGASLRRLRHYAWPGNVREVEMVARRVRLGLRATGDVSVEIGEGAGRIRLRGAGGSPAGAAGAAGAAADRGRMLLLLDEVGGNRSEAARRLGVARQTLYRRLRKMGIA